MLPSTSNEPRAWAILFALSLTRENAIYGKVRLNKTLSMLQCDGFPIRNRFINIQMGPADKNVDVDAEELERKQLISIEKIPPKGKKQEGSLYRLRNQGFDELRRRYSARIENLAYRDIMHERLEEIKREFAGFDTDEIVNRVHRMLLIDATPLEFGERTRELLASLRNQSGSLEKRFDESCPICLEVLGCTDFASRSLERIVEEKLHSRESGKNMMYYNAGWVHHWADKLAKHEHVEDMRPSDGAETRFRKHIGHRLYCLEEIGGLYGIANPITSESDLCDLLSAKMV